MKYKDAELENVHVALAIGILYGLGIVTGWYLTIGGILK